MTETNNISNEDGGYSYVFKQTVKFIRINLNEEERELCLEAIKGCPVEAIGDDGDQ